MNSCNKKFIKLLPGIIALLIVFAPVQTFADYYIANDVLGSQKTSTTYEVSRVIYDFKEVGSLNSPMDIFIDQNDYLYLLDSNNSRIIILDPDDNIDRIIEGTFGKANVSMNKPEGIFVDHTGDIFIADTQNKRILHLDPTGRFVEEFVEPGERTYDNTYPFKPSKVAVDDFGRLYILNSNDYHGIILMNGENKFLGYIASTKIRSGMMDSLVRTFATEEQQVQLAREVPAYFSNFLMHDNFI
ncbi:MAG: NHL repeat-containing protein, partial [Saccharofermentanales bacterium]